MVCGTDVIYVIFEIIGNPVVLTIVDVSSGNLESQKNDEDDVFHKNVFYICS